MKWHRAPRGDENRKGIPYCETSPVRRSGTKHHIRSRQKRDLLLHTGELRASADLPVAGPPMRQSPPSRAGCRRTATSDGTVETVGRVPARGTRKMAIVVVGDWAGDTENEPPWRPGSEHDGRSSLSRAEKKRKTLMVDGGGGVHISKFWPSLCGESSSLTDSLLVL
uniref:Uncharacterized protein n=1 Tax=Coccidioides posadasii RMSCC 3488 TaxID=454284 RepID=A0A0J6FLA2_COCPO|nr:hypothetical protein CPAG_05943 [Coccidioides posadasii RMSCC 3488]